jgi:2-alkyl-3-oxoalkanoate reductase
MIKVGIIGCGQMGDVHLKLVNEIKDVQVVGVADFDLERARGLASRGKVGMAVKDLETLLEKTKPDAVHILTPPFTHASLAHTALQAGCHVFVEKPMAMTTLEAREMVASSASHKRILTVGHNHLFNPVVREAYSRLKDGYIGRLVGIDVFHGSLPISAPWISRLPSGPWFNDIDHLLYLSRLFVGDAHTIRAVGFSRVEKQRMDEVHIATLNNDGWGSLTYSVSTVPFQIRLTLFGDKRTVSLDLLSEIMLEHRSFDMHPWLRKGIASLDMASQILLRTGGKAISVLTGRERSWAGLRLLLEAFYSAIREGTASPVSLDDCLRVSEMKEEILRQLKDSE